MKPDHRLLIDLGNTRLKWRYWSNAGLESGGSAAHAEGHPASELLDIWSRRSIELAHVSCVARPALREQLRQLLQQCGIADDWPRSPAQGLGIINSYAQPEKLGIDRFLALAAAYAQDRAACCVIDVGTATTVDLCDAQGQHIGGWIAAGPRVLATALRAHTALPDANNETPEALGWAQDTEKALQFGALHAACGLIERAYAMAHEEQGCADIILTGGDAEWLSPYLHVPHRINHDLVFQGLALHAKSY